MMSLSYRLIRSHRTTLALEIRNGELIVRVPHRAAQAEIDRLLAEKRAWIEKHLQKSLEKKAHVASVPPFTQEELEKLAGEALRYIPERVRHYAALLGVRVRHITIRNQRTRWGSCSAQGNLDFNCLLMLTPPEVIDSVVVHELGHLIEMNHSEKFYREVLRVCPEYYQWHGWLKEHGDELIARLG